MYLFNKILEYILKIKIFTVLGINTMKQINTGDVLYPNQNSYKSSRINNVSKTTNYKNFEISKYITKNNVEFTFNRV